MKFAFFKFNEPNVKNINFDFKSLFPNFSHIFAFLIYNSRCEVIG